MTDLNARADRLRSLAEALHGRVIDRDGDSMTVEIPADIAPGFVGLMGEGLFLPIFVGQTTRLAPRRVTGMQGQTIVNGNDQVTTAYYRYRVGLAPRDAGKPAPSAADITAPVRPSP